MKTRFGLITPWVVLGLGGCSNYYHQINPSMNGMATYSDVKQRAVFTAWRWDDRFPWTIDAAGNPVQTGRVPVSSVLNCPEPPPDALSALARSESASVSEASQLSVAAGGTENETATSIGLRTQSTELLKQLTTDHCLAYQGGALNKADFQALTFDQQTATIAIAAIEEVGGIAKPAQGGVVTATATAPSNSSGGTPSSTSTSATATPTTGAKGAAAAPTTPATPATTTTTTATSPSTSTASNSDSGTTAASTSASAIASIVHDAYGLGFSRDICTTVLLGVQSGDSPQAGPLTKPCMQYLQATVDNLSMVNSANKAVDDYLEAALKTGKPINSATWQGLITLAVLADGGQVPDFSSDNQPGPTKPATGGSVKKPSTTVKKPTPLLKRPTKALKPHAKPSPVPSGAVPAPAPAPAPAAPQPKHPITIPGHANPLSVPWPPTFNYPQAHRQW